jgi:protein-S-isoprenylcysteine O-methyltransferase Ste14
MKLNIQKMIGIPFLLLFFNLGFVLLEKEVFNQISVLIPVVLLNFILITDILIRPRSKKKDQYNRKVTFFTALLLPFIFVSPYYEYTYLVSIQLFSSLFFTLLLILGIIILILGGILLLMCRLQLGRYGGSRIVIEDEHQLITKGVYQYIRHPMYLGLLLVFFGYFVSLGSIFFSIFVVGSLFTIFRGRMILEEKLLLEEFGEEYQEYLKHTRRLIPLIY